LLIGSASPDQETFGCLGTFTSIRFYLYHWTHLELRRYFGITDLLDEDSAPHIWAEANEQLRELTVHRILEKFQVSVICTTNEPIF
jgi:glucuronate isomerase